MSRAAPDFYPALAQVPDQTSLLLYSAKQSYDLGPAVTSADVELTIEGPSTQSIGYSDIDSVLLNSGLYDSNSDGKLDSAVRLEDDGVVYRLSDFTRGQNSQFNVTLEDEAVSLLRDQTGIKRPKSSTGHFAFAQALCREAGVEMRTPAGAKPIPSTNSQIKARVRQEDRDSTHTQGIPASADLTVKGQKATASQIRLAETALSRAAYRKAGPKATLALMMGLIVESEITNTDWSDGENRSRGPLQARPGHSAGVGGKVITPEEARDVEYMVDCFLLEPGFASRGGAISLAKKNSSWPAGTIAWNVLMPKAEYRGRYQERAEEARKWIAAFGGVSASTDKDTNKSPTRGTTDNPDEDSWDALKRMAEERGYRVFAVANVIYYGREQDFIKARPVMTVSEAVEGVDDITWGWTPRRKVNTLTVQCRAGMWSAKPGACILVEGQGPASGRYLVTRFTRSRFSEQATVECKRGTELLKPTPVQASAATTTTNDDDGAGGTERSPSGTYKGSPVPGQRPAAKSTHETGNLAGYPAFDFMTSAGTPCVAPEGGRVTRLSGKDPSLGGPPGGALGYSIYMTGNSGTQYYMTHLDKVKVRVGQKVSQGEKIAEVANGPSSWSSPHVHMGMRPWKNWNLNS